MNKERKKLERVTARASGLLEELEREHVLKQEECEQMLEDLNDLRVEAQECQQSTEPEEMQTDVESLVKDFNEYADGSKQLLQDMMDVISAGRVPREETVAELDSSIEVLKQKYSSIYLFAREHVLEEELPEADSPVEEYLHAVQNSEYMRYQQELEKCREILNDFIMVRARSDSYTLALKEFQDQANEMLRKFDSGEKVEYGQLQQESVGPQVFFEAMNCEDTGSDEGSELLDRAEEYYSSKVCRGLAAQSYYLDKAVAEPSEKALPAEDKNAVAEEEPKEKAPEEPKQENKTPDLSRQEEEVSEDTAETAETAPESEFDEALRENGAFVTQADIERGTEIIDSSAESKKITSTIFINEMRKGGFAASRIFLKELLEREVITAKYMSLALNETEEKIQGILEGLMKKGYLRKLTTLSMGTCYFVSPRLIKAMTYKESSKFIGVHQQKPEDWRWSEENDIVRLMTRMIESQLRQVSEIQLRKGPKADLEEHLHEWMDSYALYYYRKNEKEHGDLCIGGLWKSENSYDEVLTKLTEFAAERAPSRVFIGGLNQTAAKAMADTIAVFAEQVLPEGKVYLYSAEENCYFSYPELEKLEQIEDGWSGEEKPQAEEPEESSHIEQISEDAVKPSVEKVPEQVRQDKPSKPEEQDKTGSEADNSPKQKKKAEPMLAAQTEKAQYTPVHLAPREEHKPAPDAKVIEEVRSNLYDILGTERFYAASAYLNAHHAACEDMGMLPKQLGYALNDPMMACVYSADNVFKITGRGTFEDELIIAAALRTFFSNQVKYDYYNVEALYNAIKDYQTMDEISVLNKAAYTMMSFKHQYQKGLDEYADYHIKDQLALEREICDCQTEAKSFYDNFIKGRPKETAKQRRFLETKKMLFAVNGDIGQFIDSIVRNDTEFQPMIVEFLQNNFFAADSVISEDTINSDLLWNYIQGFWEKAGDMMTCKYRTDLVSHLRSNIVSATTKAVQILVRWCQLVDQANSREEDEGAVGYRRLRDSLLEDVNDAVQALEEEERKNLGADRAAGLKVVRFTLSEIRSFIDGKSEGTGRKYFYAPFLLTEDIILDERFMPDFDIHESDLKELQADQRVLSYMKSVKNAPTDYQERLEELLSGAEDNYGTAELVLEYLNTHGGAEQGPEKVREIESGKLMAKENTALRKDDFVGELELAQSYGQIDSFKDGDQKEKILQIVENWYSWAENTSNYGFFQKVMECYLRAIKENAKSREQALMDQLNEFERKTVLSMTREDKAKRVQQIKAVIKEQNYTVAEALLAHPDMEDCETENLAGEDFLKVFLDDYDDYYHPVASQKTNFISLVNKRARNKEERGARRMVENWLPGGSDLGREHLSELLNSFGFAVDRIDVQNKIGKYENYTVYTKTDENGVRTPITHPIAAFGSGAATDGFRVVCINGAYDADSLIDIMKRIGNTKHTLILLDYALTKSDRRKLARKTKVELGDKMFAVVDRVVMMFLLRHYDATKINRMMISLVVPFGYYQPYVWESSNVMPPEIFMGRKHELERIKSPTGVNIVYGGRQLGKSALLKKAREDVDRDENGDRAVYIEIKNLNYQEAAAAIGHELFDQGILDQDITYTDWSDLARAIKRRLQSDQDHIQYLLLLLDEADVFIESCEAVDYKPLDALKDIQSVGPRRFKFVIAGLRNIVRFKRDAALSNNRVLTHLESMTVTPFETPEARELIEIPLHYLGLRFPKENESLVTLILASTNYFPGLIQMYCAKLLEAMRSRDYAGYDESNTPIYEVGKKQIKKILANQEFKEQIQEKFMITLKLDEDDYYYLIALLMAYLYHQNGCSSGYSAEDIHMVGQHLYIAKIAALELEKLSALMEELKELNVLRKTGDDRYLFFRFTFFQMMGDTTKIEDELEKYMEM